MKSILILFFALVILAGGYAYFADIAEAPVPARDQRIMGIEEYVRQNISQLSPEPAVLGGTFYVTEIEAKDGRGTVWYEDGHIALIADFEYVADEYGISIVSFDVRD